MDMQYRICGSHPTSKTHEKLLDHLPIDGILSMLTFEMLLTVSSIPSPPLFGVDIATRPDLDPSVAPAPCPSEDTGEVVIVHEVTVFRAAVLLRFPRVLLLVRGKDEVVAPSILAASLDVGLLAIGRAMRWLGNAIHITAVVVLEVLLQVESEVARGIG